MPSNEFEQQYRKGWRQTRFLLWRLDLQCPRAVSPDHGILVVAKSWHPGAEAGMEDDMQEV